MTPEPSQLPDWGTLSRAERDAAYNNSAAVPDSADFVARWTAASQALRAAQPTHLDIPYAPAERTKWDLFPGIDPAAPLLVHLHGGYWQRNSRETFACLATGVAAHGWSVALPGYTLAQDLSLRGLVGELRKALDWLALNRRTYGMAGPVILSGWSAGGHLTAMLLDHPDVTAGVAISGVYELGPIRDTYLDANLRLSDEEVETLSPLRLPHVAKPLDITYGTAELWALVASSRVLHSARAAVHLPGALIPAPGHNHFTILDTLREPDGFLTRLALNLAASLT
jgi:acetyl esterase/lipase